jgi:hypothetical protein
MRRTIEQIQIIAQEAFPRYRVDVVRTELLDLMRRGPYERREVHLFKIDIGSSFEHLVEISLSTDLTEDPMFDLKTVLSHEFDLFVRKVMNENRKLRQRIEEMESEDE